MNKNWILNMEFNTYLHIINTYTTYNEHWLKNNSNVLNFFLVWKKKDGYDSLFTFNYRYKNYENILSGFQSLKAKKSQNENIWKLKWFLNL